MKRGKRYQEAAKLRDKTNLYDAPEAVAIVKKAASAKFDETIEAHFKMGLDGRHADQQIRGAVVLPNGTGKKVRVLVFAKGDKAEDAVAAGYDLTNKVIDLDKRPEVKLDEKSDKKSEKDTEDTVSKDAEEATTDENSNETESTDETLEQTGEETSENSEGASTEQTDESESTSEEKSENSYEYKTVDEIKAIENVYVFYTNEGLDVKLPGKIVAAGEYVKVEKNTVITADGKDNYVIYKVKK